MSHHKAAADQEAVKKDIVPIRLSDGGLVDRDEGIRAESNLEKMMSLRPAFENEEMKNRFPEISWSVTAASSSQVSDGATACLLLKRKPSSTKFVAGAYLTHLRFQGMIL